MDLSRFFLSAYCGLTAGRLVGVIRRAEHMIVGTGERALRLTRFWAQPPGLSCRVRSRSGQSTTGLVRGFDPEVVYSHVVVNGRGPFYRHKSDAVSSIRQRADQAAR
jgi:hypothetical protein